MIKKEWAELVYSGGDVAFSQRVSRAVKAGELRKVYGTIYTSNFTDSLEEIINRYRYQILSHFFPNGVISHRSAFDGGISSDGIIVITDTYARPFELPGLSVRVKKGPGPDLLDQPYLGNLYISSRPRAFLENLGKYRLRKSFCKNIPIEEIEKRLDQFIQTRTASEIMTLRNEAKEVSERLDMKEQFKIFEKLIEERLKINQDSSKERPFDSKQLEHLQTLSEYLEWLQLPAPIRITDQQRTRSTRRPSRENASRANPDPAFDLLASLADIRR